MSDASFVSMPKAITIKQIEKAMITEHIRQNFHRLIDTIADEQSLVDLYEAAELYLDQKELLIDTDNPALLAQMQRSLEQVEQGDLIPNEVVQQQAKQWLVK